MNEIAPLPPKPRPRKIEEGKPKRFFAKPLKKIVRAPGAYGKDKGPRGYASRRVLAL